MYNMVARICFLVLLFVTHAFAHTCIADELEDINAVNPVTSQTYLASYPFANNTQPLRLRVDTSYLDKDLLGRTCYSTGQSVFPTPTSSSSSTGNYTCSSADVLTPSIRGYLTTLVEQARKLFQDTLLVVPVQGSLRISGTSNIAQGLYGGVYLSSEYLNGIAGLDMVIFVTARPILQDGSATSTLAVAKVVQEDQYGRPIFGHLNINVAGIDVATAMYKRNFGVVIHEMTHALGFTVSKFGAINPHPDTPFVTDITKTVTLNVAAKGRASARTIITSPRVLAWAKNHFGCSSVKGVELENQGGTGTAGSHWEKRTVFNEYMTGTASRNPVFSDLTLALLEDAGWYRVNYSQAGQLLWGQGMGCDFTNLGCDSWPSYQGYFCSENGKKGCTADYQAKGVCQIGSGQVSDEYQYFSDPLKVGAYDLPDFCPLTWGYENGWCFDTNAASSSLVNKGEVFGENSRCFDSSLVKDLPVGGSSDSACYETYCTGPAELRLKIGDYWYLCPPGAEIKVVGYGGVVKCPARIQQICAYSETDATWPLFVAISPNAGGPGLRVNITGRNFVEGITVRIGDPLIQVVIHSPTLISATIPASNRFKNPTNLIEQPESVVLTDTRGRSSVGYNSFTIKVKLNKEFIKNALDYLKDNPLIAAAIAAAIVITCSICGYCCYRQKGIAEEADTEYYD